MEGPNVESALTSQGINVVQIEGQTYIALPPESVIIDELGVSQVTEAEAQVPSSESPGLVQPGYILVDMDTFMDVGISTGALEGVTQVGGEYVIDSAAFALSLENKFHEIILSILDNWIESIEEQSQRHKEMQREDAKKSSFEWVHEYQNSDAYKQQLTKDVAIVGIDTKIHVSPTEQLRVWEQQRENLNTGRINAMNNYVNRVQSGEAMQVPFIMGSLAIGATFAADFFKMAATGVVPPTSADVNLALNTVQQVGGPMLTQNLAALGYLGASLLVGASILTNTERVAGRQGEPEKTNLNQARAYAENVLKALEEDSDASFLIQAAAEGNGDLAAMTKVTLAALPLALLYRMEAGPEGRITAEEFGALIRNEIKDIPQDDPKFDLIRTIQEQLSLIKDPDARADLLERIMAYLDSNPEAEKLLDAAGVAKQITAESKNDVLAA